jgi:diaminohydroxyphosphoribosylaminopyrimidine deaminase/5-amino-6-(5-phosphoribosylamino)uracil reductase
MTLDGKIADASGASRWITGEAARLEAHRLRFAADAILVGVGTVLQDDPELTVRLPGAPGKEPWRVVADSRLRVSPAARLFTAGEPARAVVASVAPAPPERAAALRGRGVRVLELPGEGGRVDLAALLAALARMDVVGLLVEAGSELAAALLQAGLIDRVAFFVAPRLLGGRSAPGPLGGEGLHLKEAVRLSDVTYRQIGDDILIEGDVAR